MKIFLAAYTLAPSGVTWDAAQEAEYYNELKEISSVHGLEVPMGASFHPHDEHWFLQNIDPSWRFSVTCMPGVMSGMAKNPHCGIASDDVTGRAQAINFYQAVQQSVLRLHSAIGQPVVESVQLHCAPNRNDVEASSDALLSSLREITSWDWGGAKLVVEHCDAAKDSKPVEKGFLSIDEEIDAVQRLNQESDVNVALSVNWGRSAIEAQSVDGPFEHISKLSSAGLLYGVTFSGVCDQMGPYGVWRDTHAPFAPYPNVTEYTQESLLTPHELARCLQASKSTHESFVGIKIAAKPNTLDTAQRAAYYRDACAILEQFRK